MPASLNRTLLAVCVLLIGALAACTATTTTAKSDPVPPLISPTSLAACVAPAGMTELLDQDTSDSQLPWERKGTAKTVIHFAAKDLSPEWRSHLRKGSAAWNKSPCLDTRIVDSCPAGTNCVTVSEVTDGDDGNFDSIEEGGFTVGGHITLLNSLSPGEKKNVAAHELGHAIGLVHRKTNRVLMDPDTYDNVFDPDTTDHQNLLFSYGRQL